MEKNDLLTAQYLKYSRTCSGSLASRGAGCHLRWWNHGHLCGLSPFQDGLEGCSLTWAGQVRISDNKNKETGLLCIILSAVTSCFYLLTSYWSHGIGLLGTVVTPLTTSSQRRADLQGEGCPLCDCGGLALVKGPVPTQPLAFLPQQDRERIGWRSLWIKIKTWRLFSSYCRGQNRPALGRIKFK